MLKCIQNIIMIPAERGYTIYSKSGCPNCRKVKDLLKEHCRAPLVIDCDEALLEDRLALLQYLRECGSTGTQFPFVFVDNRYLGGYEDTKRHLEQDAAFADVK